jgi:hypothetical protein
MVRRRTVGALVVRAGSGFCRGVESYGEAEMKIRINWRQFLRSDELLFAVMASILFGAADHAV